ncbi:MAG: hypothetical protein ACLFTR_04955 [Candidatus Woesearchaeota archaeon]
MKTSRDERIRYIRDVTDEAKSLGMPASLMNEILKNNKVSFLAVVNRIIRKRPDPAMCYKVTIQARNMRYVASILGDWVYEVTPSIRTFREALKYYMRYMGELKVRYRNNMW